jgi:zinc transport system substrate-binding protein
MRKLTLFFVMSLVMTSPVMALNVLTSIKPLEMIVHELTLESQSPSSLLVSSASPHDYALRPSDVKRIDSADLIIWFGPDLESFLVKVVEGRDNVLQVDQISGLALREFGDSQSHNHDGHDHGSHDSHFWLGPEQARAFAKAVTRHLVRLDPDNRGAYNKRLVEFEHELEQTVVAIDAQLSPIKQQGYYVFHDAYGYFEEFFGLNNLGHFTVTPDRKPGAKTLIHIRTTIRSENIQCVFSEPQFTPAVIESVTRGTHAKIGSLDPLGTNIKVEDGSYFHFLKDVSASFVRCLGQD